MEGHRLNAIPYLCIQNNPIGTAEKKNQMIITRTLHCFNN